MIYLHLNIIFSMFLFRKSPYYLCIIFLICSCTSNKFEKPISDKISFLIEQNPDSALVLLDSLAYAGKINPRTNPEFILLQVQAKDKAYKDISADTLIFQAKDFFEKQGNYESSALATFYSGRVYQNQHNYDRALKEYLAAGQIADKTKDYNLRGLIPYFIGNLYYSKMLYKEAIDFYKKSINYYLFYSPDKKNKTIYIYKEIGNAFLLNNENDSAFYYYNKGLDQAIACNDTSFIITYKNNLSVAYFEIGNIKKAKENLKNILSLNPKDSELSKLYYNLAEIYVEESLLDSALYCLNLSLEISDEKKLNLQTNIYLLYSEIESIKGNFQSALNFHTLYSESLSSIVEEKRNQDFLNIEKKYKFELVQNSYEQVVIEKQNILIICIVLFVCILIISFFLYRKHSINKQLSDEFYLKSNELDCLSQNLNENKNEFQKAFAEQFKILEKTATLSLFLDKEEKLHGKKLIQKFNEIVYSQKEGVNWDILYDTMNKMSDNYLDVIKSYLPQLNDIEFKICCLTYVKLNNTQISIILKLALDTIQAKKTGIRKKLGMSKNENLKEYLENLRK